MLLSDGGPFPEREHSSFSKALKAPAHAALLTQVPAVWQHVLPRAVA